MIIGFSTGCLYKNSENLSKASFEALRLIGANAVEIMYREESDFEQLLELDAKALASFSYRSLHAPQFELYSDVEKVAVLEKVEFLHKKFDFKTVVIHPYATMNWDILRGFNLPYAIENMDWKKDIGKYVESMQDIFSKFDCPMVLDINHCFTNDPSMNLTADMFETFGDRIIEIHLSGFENLHEPLFQTQQNEMMMTIQDKNIPIIIESGSTTTKEDIKKQYDYIKAALDAKI